MPNARAKLRSKIGCMPCRKKKKKCDEAHPLCNRCSRTHTVCVWPTADEQMDRRFRKKRAALAAEANRDIVIKVDQTLQQLPETITIQNVIRPVSEDTKLMEVKEEDDWSLYQIKDQKRPNTIEIQNSGMLTPVEFYQDYNPYEGLHSSSDEESNEVDPMKMSLSFSPIKTYKDWLPGLDLEYFEAKALFHFLHDYAFIILPPYSDQRFCLHNTLVPMASEHKPLLDIFMACGAHYASHYDKSFKPIRQMFSERYVNGLKSLMASGDVKGDEEWLFGGVQLMIGLDKLKGTSTTTIVKHIQFGASLVRQQLLKKKLTLGMGRTPPHETVEGRSLLESFVYHYTVAILFCSDEMLKLLPHSHVASELIRILETPLFESEIPWANNPLMGCAIEIFALAIKIQWLFRTMEPTPEQISTGTALLFELESWEMFEDNTHKSPYFQYAINYAYLVKHAMHILLIKTLRPQVHETDPEIQQDVMAVIARSSTIQAGDSSGSTGNLMFWPLAISGLAAVTEEQRKFFRQRIWSMGEQAHGEAKIDSVMVLYEYAWSIERNYPGLNTLHNRQVMADCSI
ncbi:unnamed protein product [Kuraishia capsulata CBS 1993]|uniref:Zn(2)-C6 fungal-type domain-containing protein n=1 Tax=Kuraishia capsulata CBS 1993 TaxID=1382522 RepID=W6MLF5_9ASCO|nr:uncharacterized protein KUCA_T00001607001 [Kuraishia capsulata CBS 1993]CDK25637.1 unnamed protein product [Kuraishia capsulata CBS 1993]